MSVSLCGKQIPMFNSYLNSYFFPGIHSKNLVAILHLLVALARFFQAPIRLPDNVVITILVVQVCMCYFVKRCDFYFASEKKLDGN